jgi:GH24 family phage-related lysozyme (muramidase)
MGMNLFQLQKDHPLDLSKLEHITDPDQYDAVIHEAIRNQLKSGGLISPTDGITNFQLEKPDTPSWLGDMMNRVLKDNPDALDDPGSRDTYLQRRFEFISSHEGWRENTYRDSRNLRTVGYGFNLEEPTNRNLFKTSLGKTDEDFDKLRNGETSLSKREGRILFEASAGAAEQKISNTFKDSNLKGYERLALVSLAYNHPALIGPNLTKYVNTGDKEAVLDEIRNRSNLHKSKGISNRRDLEARMFSGMDPDDVEDSNWSLASMLGISSAEASTMKSSDQLIEQGRGLNVQQTQVSDRSMPRPKRKPDAPKEPEKTGSWLAGILPAAVRSFANDMMGRSLEDTRNEDWLSQGEQTALREVTLRKIMATGKKSGAVDYEEFEGGIKDVAWNNQQEASGIVKRLFTDDQFSVKYTLGAYNYRIDDRGHLIITDQYNWNDAKRLQKQNPSFSDKVNNLQEYQKNPQVNSYGMMRRIGALFGSVQGKGPKWEMDLGPVSDQRFKAASR